MTTVRATGRLATYHAGKPYLGIVTLTVSPGPTSVVVDCHGDGYTGQGSIEQVPATGYEHWKAGARAGVLFALLAAKTEREVVVTAVSGLTTDSNPTTIAIAAARAVWSAITFSPSANLEASLQKMAFASWSQPADAVPDFSQLAPSHTPHLRDR
jgi:hypothetical protein